MCNLPQFSAQLSESDFHCRFFREGSHPAAIPSFTEFIPHLKGTLGRKDNEATAPGAGWFKKNPPPREYVLSGRYVFGLFSENNNQNPLLAPAEKIILMQR